MSGGPCGRDWGEVRGIREERLFGLPAQDFRKSVRRADGIHEHLAADLVIRLEHVGNEETRAHHRPVHVVGLAVAAVEGHRSDATTAMRVHAHAANRPRATPRAIRGNHQMTCLPENVLEFSFRNSQTRSLAAHPGNEAWIFESNFRQRFALMLASV